jgi:hypothetical protein
MSHYVFAADFDRKYRGLYSWGEGVESFSPCSKNIEYWVSYNLAGIEMHQHYKNKHSKPYQPMYIEFRGHILNEKVDGFAENYDGLIHISEVYGYSFKVPPTCN